MKEINSLLLGSLLFVACKDKGTDELIEYYYTYNFAMINNSGVQVAVVAGDKNFPDSLVILNGAKYEWV